MKKDLYYRLSIVLWENKNIPWSDKINLFLETVVFVVRFEG